MVKIFLKVVRVFRLMGLVKLLLACLLIAESPKLAGAVEVNLRTGAASHHIPIEVPPGSGDLTPALALVYNSDTGNDWIGDGWTLEGLGYIERRGPNYAAEPTFAAEDTYVLRGGTGGKLIKSATDPGGTTGDNYYRTQTESFLRIEYINAGYWLVTDKGGTRFYFGQSVASRQESLSRAFRWYLDKVEDLHGNFWTVSYDKDPTQGDIYPSQIVYTQGNGLSCTPTNLNSCRVVNFILNDPSANPRSDTLVSYQAGVKITSDRLLKRIEVKMGGRLVRAYDLSYEMSPATARGLRSVSQLKSLSEVGADGTALPSTTFTHNIDGNASILSFGNTGFGAAASPPVDLVNCVYTADINGDGLPDILVGNPGAYSYYPNLGGTGFGTTAISLPGDFPSLCSTRTEKRRDNIARAWNVFSTAASAASWIGTFIASGGTYSVGFYVPQFPTVIEVIVPVHDAAVIDLDGDGFPDVIDGKTANAWRWWRNQHDNTFAAATLLNGSPPVPLNDEGVRFVDMDHDGLTDIIRFVQLSQDRPTSTSQWEIKWWRNLGGGQFNSVANSTQSTIYKTYPTGAIAIGNGFGSAASDFTLTDINGDGVIDLVWGAHDCRPCSSTDGTLYYYRPGTGNGNFSSELIPLLMQNGQSFPYGDVAYYLGWWVHLVDINGDGLPDVLAGAGQWIDQDTGEYHPPKYYYYPNVDGKSWGDKVDLSASALLPPPVNFLSRDEHMMLADVDGDGFVDILKGDNGDYRVYRLPMSDNHHGMETVHTPLGATTTINYQNQKIDQGGGSRWVVRQILQDNGVGPTSTIAYDYSIGRFERWPWNEFRGFAAVTVTDPIGATIKTSFLQDHYRKGHVESIEVRGAPGPNGQAAPLLTHTDYTYLTNEPTANGIFRADLTAEIIKIYDQQLGVALPAHIEKRTEYADFDSYGQPHTIINSGARTATRTTRTDFLINNSAYIVNRPSYIEMLVGGITVSKKWFAYDGQAEGVSPSKGDLTQERQFLSGGNSPIIQYAYDIYGNRIGTVDAKNNKCSATGYTTRIDFDTTYRTFPVAETNALCQATSKTYWGINTGLDKGNVPGAFDVPGLLATVTDPNQIITQYYWDAHSRPKAKVIPPDVFQSPTVRWSYSVTGIAPSTTTEQQRDESPLGGGSLDRVTYVDGLNRTIQTKAEAETAGQWITQDTKYNNRGLVESVSIPYLTSGTAYSSPQAQPKTTTLYDAVRRPTQVTNPDNTLRTTKYSQWVVTDTDEKGYATTRTYDALGRLISVVEPFGGATTLYAYDIFDGAGNNRQTITDATGLNITTTIFDTLGQKTIQSDPDLGTWRFTYDPNGNLLTQTDAKGQVTAFVYDKLNRVKQKIMNGPDSTAPVLSTPSAGGISSTGAVISWTTDEYADSLVEYGTTTAYGKSSGDTDFILGHAVFLSGLSSSTLYHYRVKSKDPAGNMVTSGDFTFTSASAPDTTPPTISNVASNNIASTSTTITWTTNEVSDSQVEYGTTTSYGSSTTPNTSFVTSHSMALSNLSPSTLYHYRVKSKDAAGNLAVSSDFTFTSSTPDTTPPIISNVTSGSVTVTGATITWTTNEASDSQVEYGTTTSYGSSSSLNTAMVTSHSETLSSLSSSILYHYRVKSRDAAGNLAISGDFTFTTVDNPGAWTTKASIPTPRYGLGAGVVNGILYAVGGREFYGAYTTNVEAYNPSTNSWSSKAAMPTGRYGPAVGVVNGILYVVGGFNGSIAVGTVEAYNPVTNTWSTKAAMPTARYNMAAGVINGILYVVGGINPSGSTLATVEAYDPATNTWSTKAAMPTARIGPAAGVINGILYAAGGRNGSLVATVEAYDPATNTWSTKAAMPTARNYAAAGVINGILYVVGGSDPSTIGITEAYDPVVNSWSTKPAMQYARSVPAADTISGILYAVGGSGGESILEAFTPSGDPALTVLKSGTGAGSVTSSPAGINCGGSCSSSLALGTSVTLTASPNVGSTFAGFSGGCTSATNTCTFTITANSTVTATFNDTQAPTVPSNLTATAASGSQINLSWIASTDNMGVSGYWIERCQGMGCSNFVRVNTSLVTTTSYSNTGLTTGTSYSYRVQAADAVGNLSPYSNIPSSTTNPVLTLTKSGTGGGSVTSSPAGINCGAACSVLFASGTSVTLTATATTGSTFAGFSGGCTSATTTCTFTLAADTTVTATFNDTQAPNEPASFTATTSGSNQINLTWTASTDNVGVSGYWIERCQGAGCSTFARVNTSLVTTTSYSNTGLTASTSYSYRVQAADGVGNLSPYSNIASATTASAVTSGAWTTKASIPTQHYGLGAGVINGIFYAVGGRDNFGAYTTNVEAYNPLTNSWSTKASMPTGRYTPAVGVVNNILYVVGGYNGSTAIATVEAYDPTTNTWSTKAAMPTARYNVAAGVVNGILYVVGGTASNGSTLATVQAYNPSTNTWSTKASMPTARSGPAVGVINGILYVAGGRNGNLVTVVEAYDPSTNTWSTRTAMLTARDLSGAGVINGIFYVVGGANPSPITTTEAYDPVANSWSTKAAMQYARSGLGADVIGGILYAVGGSGGETVLEAFTP